jgi:hypothetical protein
MGYKSLLSALLVLLFLPGTGTAGLGADTVKVLSLSPLSPDIEVENKCGTYFGYEAISGTTLKRILFNYEDGDQLLFTAVAYSTLDTRIVDGNAKPTVEYTTTGDIIIRISDKEYQKEKDCLPPPEHQEPPTP